VARQTAGNAGADVHTTKNLSAGEGGALLLGQGDRQADYARRASIIRTKGTNREQFMQGTAPHYMWVDVGSSWAMNELNAAYLWGNMTAEKEIHHARHRLWDYYAQALHGLEQAGHVVLPVVPQDCEHNAHIFHIRLADAETRGKFLSFMREESIGAVFHYIPLHSSPAGKKFGRFSGADRFTSTEAARLVRLPLYYGLTMQQAERVVSAIHSFYAHG
jgi:dTDP-4-amino-4,6-dideoxygalactose transaminase